MRMIAFALLFARACFAGIIFSQPPTPGPVHIWQITSFRHADDFVLSAPAQLASIEFWAVGSGGFPAAFSGTLSWAVYDDSGGAPGTLRFSGSTSSVRATDTGIYNFFGNRFRVSFNLGTPVPLAAGKKYWLELHEGPTLISNDGSEILWITGTPSGAMVERQLGGGGWYSVPEQLAFQLSDEPLPESVPPPTADDLNTICPTAQEIQDFTRDFSIQFESDPTAGTLVCRAADGSADLTRLQERTYQALRLMQQIPFDTPLPWTEQPLYDWFKSAIHGIRLRGDIQYSYCCDPAGVINIQTQNLGALTFNTPEWLTSLMALFVHEARHNEGYPHTCGSNDQRLDELGSWGVQYYLNEWLAYRTGDFLTPYRDWIWNSARNVLNGRFCQTAALVVSPLQLDFGTISVGGASMARPVVITSGQGSPLGIDSATLGGPDASAFEMFGTTCGGRTVPPSCAALVDFRPSGVGLRTATLTVVSAAAGSTQWAVLSGTGDACSYSLSAPGRSVTAGHGSGSFRVTAGDGCPLTANSTAGWISVSSIDAAGTVTYVVAQNFGAPPRTGAIRVGSQTFPIAQEGTAPEPLRFVPLAPCRLADTRAATNKLGFTGAQDFSVSGVCGVPSEARAYALNVSAIPRAASLGFLAIWAAGQPQPVVSTLNSFDARVKANAALVPAGGTGKVTVFVSDAADVLLDVNGYFVSTSVAPGALAYYPVAPCRVTDTRAATGKAGFSGLWTVPMAGNCGLPAAAQAYAVNFTVIPRAASFSFLSAWPTGQSQPGVSTLNAFTGAVTANAAIVSAGTGAAIDVYHTDMADLLIDVSGYFAPAAAGGLSFYTATPCRALDTRADTNKQGFSGTRDQLLAAGVCPLPPASAYSLNATVLPRPQLDFLTLWATGGAQPPISTLNSFDRSVVSNAAIVPATNGSITAYHTQPADLLLDVNGYFAP